MKYPHLVFGYGSLICPDSRAITAPTVANRMAVPVSIQGVERTWTKQSLLSRTTSMGVQFRDNAQCVGVLIPVNQEELESFDEREVGYDRYEIPLHHVQPVPHLLGDKDTKKNATTTDVYSNHTFLQLGLDSTSPSPPSRVWIYVQQNPVPPSPQYPIAQSYVDIMLRGCLSISEEFAHEFIETTKGWHPAELMYGDDHDDDDADNVTDEEEDSDMASSDDDDDDGSSRSSNSDSTSPSTKRMEIKEGWWVDDRLDPLYIRADPHYSLRHRHKIDRLLKAKLPKVFNSRIRRGRSQVVVMQ